MSNKLINDIYLSLIYGDIKVARCTLVFFHLQLSNGNYLELILPPRCVMFDIWNFLITNRSEFVRRLLNSAPVVRMNFEFQI